MDTDDPRISRFERPVDRERRALLDCVVPHLRDAAPELTVRYELIDPYFGTWGGPREPLLGLVIESSQTPGHVQVLTARFSPTLQMVHLGSGITMMVGRTGAVDRSGESTDLVPGFEILILQEPWSGPGHVRQTPVDWLRCQAPEDAATFVVRWSRFEEESAVTPPLPSASTRSKRLRALAAAKLADVADPRIVDAADLDVAASLDLDGRRRLAEDRVRASAARIWWHFPRDGAGRLQLDTKVLLERYDVPSRRSPKGIWLLVAGPAHRSQEQQLVLRVEAVVGEYYEHRWDRSRWMWDEGTPEAPAEELWRLMDAERATRCAALLESGELLEAMQICEVRLAAPVHQLVHGRPPAYQLRDLTPKWTARVHQELARSAPWLFAPAIAGDEQERRGRGLKSPRRALRLFGLGGVTQVRKPGVFLARTDGAELQLQWSADPTKLRETEWVRPIDFDLARHGLIEPSQIPGVR